MNWSFLTFSLMLCCMGCQRQGNLGGQFLGSLQGNSSAPKVSKKTVPFCNNQQASNYKPGVIGPLELENCLFSLCLDGSKIGFKPEHFEELINYIEAKGGALKNSDQDCGDDLFKIPTQEVPFPSGFEQYHTYKEVIQEMNQIAADSLGLVTLESIGTSSEGLPLLMARVSAQPSKAASNPGLMIVGTHHAREHLATETPLLILKKLVNKAVQDPIFKQQFFTKTLYVLPLLNPDGMLYDLKNGKFQFWRKNTRVAVPSSGQRGVDLNRNYDSSFGGEGASSSPSSDVYHGPHAFSEQETTALKKFLETKASINFVLSFHSFSELVLYPWGGKASAIPANDLQDIKAIAQKMSSYNGYQPMQASALYIASGDFCDWCYEKLNKFCITIELSPSSSSGANGFYPEGKIINSVVEKNYPIAEYLMSIIANPRGVVP